VWISNNTGIAPGIGTPVYPGTSLQWMNPSELFAVSANAAEILVTSEIDDWQGDPIALATAIATEILQSGVVVIDNPVTLIRLGVLTSTNTSTAIYDVSRYNTLTLDLGLLVAGTDSSEVTLNFLDDLGNVLGSHSIMWHTPQSPRVRMSFPIRGSGVQLTQVTGSPMQLRIFAMVASSRIIQSIETQIVDIVVGDLYNWQAYNSSVAIGAAVDLWIPPWYGNMVAECRIGASAALGATELVLQRYNGAGGGWAQFSKGVNFTIVNATGNVGVAELRYPTNGQATMVRLQNRSTVALSNAFMSVTPEAGNGW